MAWNSDMLREYATATHEKQHHGAEEKKAKARLNALDEPIQAMFVEEGVPSAKIETPARDVDAEALEVVKRALCDVDTTQLSAHQVALLIVPLMRDAGLLIESTRKKTTTIFIGTRVWAKPVKTGVDDKGEEVATNEDYERACRALIDKGYGQYVRNQFNILSLSAAIKEDVDAGAIPEGVEFFDGTIEVESKSQVQTRVKNG